MAEELAREEARYRMGAEIERGMMLVHDASLSSQTLKSCTTTAALTPLGASLFDGHAQQQRSMLHSMANHTHSASNAAPAPAPAPPRARNTSAAPPGPAPAPAPAPAPSVDEASKQPCDTTQPEAETSGIGSGVRSTGSQAHGPLSTLRSGVDYTQIPKALDKQFEELDTDSALRPTIIKPGNTWTHKSQKVPTKL